MSLITFTWEEVVEFWKNGETDEFRSLITPSDLIHNANGDSYALYYEWVIERKMDGQLFKNYVEHPHGCKHPFVHKPYEVSFHPTVKKEKVVVYYEDIES